jgi:hypothetical protein
MKRIFIVFLLLLVGTVAYADVNSRAAFLRQVIGNGVSVRVNIASIANPSAGTYTLTLTNGCPQALGIVNVNANRGDGICFGDFTATNVITVTCRNSSNTLANIPNGTIVQLVAYCAVP